MSSPAPAGLKEEKGLGSFLGVSHDVEQGPAEGRCRSNPRARRPLEGGPVKKVLFISVAVTALLVLALGGWAVKSVRRTPAYA